MEGADVGIDVIDTSYNVVMANTKSAQLCGKSSDELIGQKCFRAFRGRKKACGDCPGFQALATAKPAEIESSLRKEDGSTVFLRIKATPLLDENAEPTGFVEIVEDITDRKRTEEALRDSEERYRRLFEVETDAVLLLDCETERFLDANPAALKLYGYGREEFLRLTIGDVSAEPDKTRQAMARHETRIPLRWHRKKDGTVFPVEISGSFFDRQGRTIHVATIRDITERKRAEEALATGQGSRRGGQPRQERVPGQHEPRNPHAHDGDSRVQRPAAVSRICARRTAEFLEGIRRNGKALLELIGDILDLSRLEADRLTLEKVDCPAATDHRRRRVDRHGPGEREGAGPEDRLRVAAARNASTPTRRGCGRSS